MKIKTSLHEFANQALKQKYNPNLSLNDMRFASVLDDVEIETSDVDCKHCHPPFQYWQRNDADGFLEGTFRVQHSNKGKPVLIYNHDEWTYDMEELITVENVIPIRCCPMCGRKLEVDDGI